MLRPLVVVLITGLILAGCKTLESNETDYGFQLRPGDLLFQDLDAGPLCDAIETVTEGVDGSDFSHIGMVSQVSGDRVLVIEAVSKGVVETPLSEFLARSTDANGKPKVLVGRIRPKHADVIVRAIEEARRHLGKPYDSVYVMDNSSFYCSELLYESFRVANNGIPLFSTSGMTFIDPATGKTFPAWTAYYEKLGVAIPEGEPGLNPGGMSRSDAIEIVHAFGVPDGWTGRKSSGKPR